MTRPPPLRENGPLRPGPRQAGRRFETSETDAGEVEFNNLREDAFEAVRQYVAAKIVELGRGGK